MKSKLKTCVQQRTVDAMEESMRSKVDYIAKSIAKYEVDNSHMLECVQSFDSTLCTKANKQALISLEQELRDMFITKDKTEKMK